MTRVRRTSGHGKTARWPPFTLCGCRVEQFAVRDRSFTFSGHGLLFVNGKDLGPVPRLALARDRDGEVQLLHCDARWKVLGVSVYPNIRTAKMRAERFYVGISRAWQRTGYSRTQANRHLEKNGANRKCAVCRKPWWEVEGTVEVAKTGLTICVECIRKLYELARGKRRAPRGGRALKETRALSAIPGMKDSIAEGLNTPVARCSRTLT